MNKRYVSWDEVEDAVSSIVQLQETCPINASGVYGLPRGGLVLAVMLSHQLDLPLLAAPAENCIIVDDICDSGESLLHYVRNSSSPVQKQRRTFTMFYKPQACVTPNFYYQEVPQDTWIVFPWERKD